MVDAGERPGACIHRDRFAGIPLLPYARRRGWRRRLPRVRRFDLLRSRALLEFSELRRPLGLFARRWRLSHADHDGRQRDHGRVASESSAERTDRQLFGWCETRLWLDPARLRRGRFPIASEPARSDQRQLHRPGQCGLRYRCQRSVPAAVQRPERRQRVRSDGVRAQCSHRGQRTDRAAGFLRQG